MNKKQLSENCRFRWCRCCFCVCACVYLDSRALLSSVDYCKSSPSFGMLAANRRLQRRVKWTRRHDSHVYRDVASWRRKDARQYKPHDDDCVKLNWTLSLSAAECVVYLYDTTPYDTLYRYVTSSSSSSSSFFNKTSWQTQQWLQCKDKQESGWLDKARE